MKLSYLPFLILVSFSFTILIFFPYSKSSTVNAQEGDEAVTFIWPAEVPEVVKTMLKPIYVAGSKSYSLTGGDLWKYQIGLRGAGGEFTNALPEGGYWVDIQPLMPKVLYWDHPVSGAKPQTILPGITVYAPGSTPQQITPKVVYDNNGTEYLYESFLVPSSTTASKDVASDVLNPPQPSISPTALPSASETPNIARRPIKVTISQYQKENQIFDLVSSDVLANVSLSFDGSGVANVRFQIDYDSGDPEVYYIQYKLKKGSDDSAKNSVPTPTPEPIRLIDFNGDGVINIFDMIEYQKRRLGL